MALAPDQELTCVECGRVARGSETASWRAYLTIDGEVAIYCEACAEREFDDGGGAADDDC